jgi:hypothetical protein
VLTLLLLLLLLLLLGHHCHCCHFCCHCRPLVIGTHSRRQALAQHLHNICTVAWLVQRANQLVWNLCKYCAEPASLCGTCADTVQCRPACVELVQRLASLCWIYVMTGHRVWWSVTGNLKRFSKLLQSCWGAWLQPAATTAKLYGMGCFLAFFVAWCLLDRYSLPGSGRWIFWTLNFVELCWTYMNFFELLWTFWIFDIRDFLQTHFHVTFPSMLAI